MIVKDFELVKLDSLRQVAKRQPLETMILFQEIIAAETLFEVSVFVYRLKMCDLCKERNIISTCAFVPILLFVSCLYIHICIEKFE